MKFSNHIIKLLVVALLLILAGCGSNNVGSINTDQTVDDRIAAGVTLGGYEVIRYNTDGVEDPGLNRSLGLSIDGDALVISVDDAGIDSVALNVNYNGNNVHPGTVEFHGMFSEEGMLSASFTGKAGVAGIASYPIGGTATGGFSGEFATVSFEPGALRTVSAPGDVHHGTVGETYGAFQNLFGEGDTTARTAAVSWTKAFNTGDGDQNKETNAADLGQIAIFFGQNTGTNWLAAVADYDDNGEVNAADITPIALFYQERTDGFEIQFSDNVDGALRTVFPGSPMLWDTGVPPAGAPSPGDFFTVFDSWRIDVNDTTPWPYDDLAALDANADGFVYAHVANATFTGSPPVVDQMGLESFVQVPVTNIPEETHADIIVTGYEVQVEGTSITVFGGTNLTGDFAANEPVIFSLFNVMGTFDGEPFDKDTLPTAGEKTMTQDNFDDVFTSCQTLLGWTFGDGGDAAIRRTSSWVVLDSGQTGTINGDPGPGVVFPDDDPQSVAPVSEGMVDLELPPGGEGVYPWDTEIHTTVLSTIAYPLVFDVLADATAPVINDYGGLTELELVVKNDLLMDFDFGSGGEPADLATTLLQLVPIDPNTGFPYDPADRNWIALSYVPENPDLDEFTMFIFGEESQIFAQVNGANLQADTTYAARMQADGVWSSINKPDDTLGVRPFEAPDIAILPTICGPEVTEIQLFPLDPQVRRNGAMTFDLLTGNPIFEDTEAFNDVLKMSAELDAEFPIEYDAASFSTYPQIVVIPGTSSASITGPEDPNHQAGVQVTRRQGNKLVLDISVITRPTGPGDDLFYAFRIFTKDGVAFGDGTFSCVFLDLGTPDPIGIDWSVNLFDRELTALADRNHDFVGSNRADGPSVNTMTPDVLWFEFSGGWLYGGLARDMVEIQVEEVIGVENMPMDILVEVAGVTPAGDVLAFHPLHIDDFFNPINPTGGILRAGSSYTLKINESTSALPPFEYTDKLTVVGSPF